MASWARCLLAGAGQALRSRRARSRRHGLTRASLTGGPAACRSRRGSRGRRSAGRPGSGRMPGAAGARRRRSASRRVGSAGSGAGRSRRCPGRPADAVRPDRSPDAVRSDRPRGPRGAGLRPRETGPPPRRAASRGEAGSRGETGCSGAAGCSRAAERPGEAGGPRAAGSRGEAGCSGAAGSRGRTVPWDRGVRRGVGAGRRGALPCSCTPRFLGPGPLLRRGPVMWSPAPARRGTIRPGHAYPHGRSPIRRGARSPGRRGGPTVRARHSTA